MSGPSDTRRLEAPGGPEVTGELPPAVLVRDRESGLFRFLDGARFEALETELAALVDRLDRLEGELSSRDYTIDDLQARINTLEDEVGELRADRESRA